MKILVGNDNGNSAQKIVIDGNIFEFPNVYAEWPKKGLPNSLDQTNPEYVAKNIFEQQFVAIESPAISQGVQRIYYVGKNAINNSGRVLTSMDIGRRGSKLDTDLPLITTLTNIASYALKKELEKKELNDIIDSTLNVQIDMATALPVIQYSKENAKIFRDKFLGKHKVKLYLGEKTVNVVLNFEYVKTIAEGVPIIYYLLSDKVKGTALSQYNFNEKKILHVSIGEGTTEYPVTEGIMYNASYNQGSNNGIGIAIDNILDDFLEETGLDKYSRQEMSNLLRNPQHKKYPIAESLMEIELRQQAEAIKKKTFSQFSKLNQEVDYILIYGGGSILLEPYLREAFENDDIISNADTEVVYITDAITTTLEAMGLYEFARLPEFKQAAAKFKDKAKKQEGEK